MEGLEVSIGVLTIRSMSVKLNDGCVRRSENHTPCDGQGLCARGELGGATLTDAGMVSDSRDLALLREREKRVRLPFERSVCKRKQQQKNVSSHNIQILI